MKQRKKKPRKGKITEKNRWHRIELLAAVCLVLVLSGVLFINIDLSKISGLERSNNLITGFVSSDVVSQKVDLEIGQSQIYHLVTEDEFTLTSLRLSGSIDGPGLVQIFLEDPQGKKFLVYQNIKKKQKGNLITGYAVATDSEEAIEFTVAPGEIISAAPTAQVAEDQVVVSGAFYQKCTETFFLSIPFSPHEPCTIIFYLEEGTKLDIDQFIYTIE